MTVLHYMIGTSWKSKIYHDCADAMRVFNGKYHLGHYQDGIIEVYHSNYSIFPEERYFFDKYFGRWERQ